jgi:SAM-dependent methyltransferase
MAVEGQLPEPPELPEHVARNRAAWDEKAPDYVAHGEQAWREAEPSWGIFGVPERLLHVLPDELAGKDAIELGCGTAYVSAWLARRGARPVGIDNSPKQLETARRLQTEHELHFPLHLGNAEAVPYPEASFDLTISEYGASLWADPYRWILEAARLLRSGGELIFLTNAAIWMLCVPELDDQGPAADRLLRPYFGMYRSEWPDEPGVEFHLPHGEWIRLLRRSGFEVTDLIEVQPPEGSQTSFELTTLEWARQWPCEEIWKARKVDR